MEGLATDFLSNQTGVTATLIGVVAVLCWIIPKILKGSKAVWSFFKKLVTVVEDLFGAEARPGVEARPGLMARMAASEANDVQVNLTLAETKATLAEHSSALLELRPNHGGSMKDVLKATREELAALRKDLTTHINEQRTAVTEAKEAVVGAKEAVLAAASDRADVHVTVQGPTVNQ